MDILEKIELFLGEEISGTAVGTTTGDVAKIPSGTKRMRKRKNGDWTDDVYDEPDEEDSEDKIRKGKKVKSGSAMISSIAKTGSTGMGVNF